jgi:hypothetical protein
VAKSKKEVNNIAVIPALSLILLGLIFLLSELGIISFNPFYLILLIGVIFIFSYVITKIWAFLIPGVIITLTSVILLTNTAGVWYLWPLSVGAAFLSVYLTRQENTEWSVFPGAILVAISAIGAFEYYFNFSSIS